eukprot:COSAG02_NODE_1161_length_14173_cov_8.154469_10_plen_54_part_00
MKVPRNVENAAKLCKKKNIIRKWAAKDACVKSRRPEKLPRQVESNAETPQGTK